MAQAVDYVVHGSSSRRTPAFQARRRAEDASFEAGAGEILPKGGIGPELSVLAAKFAADDDARGVRDRLHRKNLQQEPIAYGF